MMQVTLAPPCQLSAAPLRLPRSGYSKGRLRRVWTPMQYPKLPDHSSFSSLKPLKAFGMPSVRWVPIQAQFSKILFPGVLLKCLLAEAPKEWGMTLASARASFMATPPRTRTLNNIETSRSPLAPIHTNHSLSSTSSTRTSAFLPYGSKASKFARAACRWVV